ncbi:phage capsid protein [Tetragenococcus phage phiWJ7]|nr:phage capsid protein [Tetragenococcus phage phiWJ7]
MANKADNVTKATVKALDMWNKANGTSWTFGTNWTNVNTKFETFVNKFLFPKINETNLSNVDLGNRFDWLAKEVDFIGQYSEDYVVLDTVPTTLDLSKPAELMLKRNYPKIATKLYGAGVVRKQKFTLNNNDTRLNFSTLGDGVAYAVGVYKKKISDINVFEEKEIRAMLVDYALNVTQDTREVNSEDDLTNKLYGAILNIQNNSDKYNETNLASGGAIGRYTTQTKLKDVAILTTDTVKTYLLNTVVGNTFQIAGLDPTSRIISFDDLGGVYRVNDDVTLNSDQTIDYFRTFGDYQVQKGDVVPAESVLTFDVSGLTEFKDKATEIKPDSDLFAFVFDVNKLKYRRNTKGMLKQPFYNGEFDEVTHWLHYYSFKAISPFFNDVRIGG